MLFGKWSEPGVPHLGWECVAVADLGPKEDGEHVLCEMCEKETIRFRHHMQHADYTDLFVGVICAGQMEGNKQAAKDRDDLMRAEARRGPPKPWEGADRGLTVIYQRVISQPGWFKAKSGNYCRKTIGFLSTAFQKGDKWKIVVKNLETEISYFHDNSYLKIAAAKKAAMIHVAHIRVELDRDPQEDVQRRRYDYQRQDARYY